MQVFIKINWIYAWWKSMEEKLDLLEQELREQNPDWWADGRGRRQPVGACKWKVEAQ